MAKRWAGIVVSGSEVCVVDAEVPTDKDEPISILSENKWTLQKGDAPSAYGVMYNRCVSFLRENKIELAVIKESAAGKGMGIAMLRSAELRGVIMAAATCATRVAMASKSGVTKTYGKRTVKEYIDDDDFWKEQTDSAHLKKWAREPTMYLVALRNKAK